MKSLTRLICLSTVSLCIATSVAAQPHKGKMDTDGILSPGEKRNPNIHYDNGNHRGQSRGALSAPGSHRGEMDTDGRLSPGELRNPNIDYSRIRENRTWYRDHDWDSRWDTHDDSYWRRFPERRWWGAQDPTWRRDDSFQTTLRDGLSSGRISRDEERELRGMRADLLRAEQDYWSDGHLSSREREELNERSEDLNNSFNHELNDGERRR